MQGFLISGSMTQIFQNPLTIVKKKGSEAVFNCSLSDGNLKLEDAFSVTLENHAYLELYTGSSCDISIKNCGDITVYCDSECFINANSSAVSEIEIFAEDRCRIDIMGLSGSGRIVCGDGCVIDCPDNVEIETGSGSIISCGRSCTVECGSRCTVNSRKPFDLFCMSDCKITCCRTSKLTTGSNCSITFID